MVQEKDERIDSLTRHINGLVCGVCSPSSECQLAYFFDGLNLTTVLILQAVESASQKATIQVMNSEILRYRTSATLALDAHVSQENREEVRQVFPTF